MRYAELPSMQPQAWGEQLPLEQLSPRPSLRRGQAPASLEALAESIRCCGLLRPVIVRRLSPGRYVIVSGNRRLMACRMLGMECISARILPDDARWQPMDRLLDALMTRRLHYLEEAEALRALNEAHGLRWEELARMLGLPAQTLQEHALLAGLEDVLQALLMEEGVPLSIALLLLRLPSGKRRMDAAQRIVQERLCIRDSALLVCADARWMKEKEVCKWESKGANNEVCKREEMKRGTDGETGRRIISVIRDHRLFLNAIRDIAGQMQAAGFPASVTERQTNGQMEMVIRVPARRRRTERYQSV